MTSTMVVSATEIVDGLRVLQVLREEEALQVALAILRHLAHGFDYADAAQMAPASSDGTMVPCRIVSLTE
jgi:hypothetical protein